jgi:NAD(P) transhydrogenase alpha subunit
MKIGVPKEIYPEEKRVALTPEGVERLVKAGFSVLVEDNAGVNSSVHNDKYIAAGAKIAPVQDIYQSDILLKLRMPQYHEKLGKYETEAMKPDAKLISFIQPAQNKEVVERLLKARITAFAMDQIPRTTRAQTYDALSSMANISGYKAIITAAEHFGRFFTGQMTAAGKLPPAKILVIGAGVAGLSATATAKSLGAIVRAFDTRPAAR